MSGRSLGQILGYALAALGALAAALAPIPVAYPAMVAAAGVVGALLDRRGRNPMPRLPLTLLGLGGFLYTLLPLAPETLAEQSLAALTFLMAVKLLEPKGGRDHLQILVLSVIMVAGGASLAPELVYAALFLADLALGVALLLWLPFAERLGEAAASRRLLGDLGKVGSWLLLAALPGTVMVFTVLPRSLNPFWGGFAPRPTAVSGFSDRMELGQVGRISLSGEVAFRAEMDDPPGPLPQTPYWRGLVLEQTDGRSWRAVPGTQGYAGAGRSTLRAVRVTYYLEPHAERELFLLEQPVSATSGFRLLPMGPGRTARLSAPVFKPVRYHGTSRPAEERAEILTAPERARNLALPGDLPPRIRRLALELAGGEQDPGTVARRVGAHFARGFSYSLEAPAGTGHPLEDFLFVHRTGYCEYFASSLAVMLRAAGVPARVVLGYLGGDWNANGRYYLVRQAAAHAWVEAYVEALGWVRLDPTPAAREGGTTLANRLARPRLWLDALRMRWNSWVVQYDTESQVDFLRGARRGARRLLFPAPTLRSAARALAVMVILALLVLLSRRKGRPPLERRYRAFLQLADSRGVPRPGHEGPLDHARRVADAWPEGGRAAVELAWLYASSRYGLEEVTPERLARIDDLLGEMRLLGRR